MTSSILCDGRNRRHGRRRSVCARLTRANPVLVLAATLLVGLPALAAASSQLIEDEASRASSTHTARRVLVAKTPVFIEVELPLGGDRERLIEDHVRRIMATSSRHPGRLIVTRVRGLALRFDDLKAPVRMRLLEAKGPGVREAYDRLVVRELSDLLDAAEARCPEVPLSVSGLPFHESSESSVRANEKIDEPIVGRLSAFVFDSNPGMSSAGQGSAEWRSDSAAERYSRGRSIIYRQGSTWRIALPSETALVHERDDVDQTAVEATAVARLDDPSAVLGKDGLVLDAVDDSVVLEEIDGGSVGGDVTSTASSGGDPVGNGSLGSNSASPAFGGGSGGSGNGGVANAGGGGATDAWDPLTEIADEDGDQLIIDLSEEDAESSGSDPSGDAADETSGNDADQQGIESEEADGEQPGNDSGEDGDGEQGSDPGEEGSGDEGDVPGDESGDIGDAGDDGEVEEIATVFAGFEFIEMLEDSLGDHFGDSSAIGAGWPVVARYNSVPHQIVPRGFEIGVIAFHSGDVRHVEFQLNGGEPALVTDMTVNPRTGVPEYWVGLDFDDTTQQRLQLVAEVVPVDGVSRRLSIDLYSPPLQPDVNIFVDATMGSDDVGDGSQVNPVRSLSRGAFLARSRVVGDLPAVCRVRLAPGEYEWTRTQYADSISDYPGWIEFEPADGVVREDVVIVTSSGSTQTLRVPRVRLSNVTVTGQIAGVDDWSRAMWWDGVHLQGEGLDSPVYTDGSWWDRSYFTDCLATEVVNGFMAADLVRGARIETLHNDAFPGCKFVVDASVSGHVGGETPNGMGFHSDIWQNRDGATDENVILFGIRSVDDAWNAESIRQGIMTRLATHVGLAIVDCEFRLESLPSGNNLGSEVKNGILLRNRFWGPLRLRISDQHASPEAWSGTFWEASSFLFEGNVFQWLGISDSEDVAPGYAPRWDTPGRDSVFFKGNHFVNEYPAWASDPDHPSYLGADAVGRPYEAVDVGADSTEGPSIPADRGPLEWWDL